MKFYDIAALRDKTILSFDTETSGAFPVGSEVVEVGYVQWRNGEVINRFQSLIRPEKRIPEFVIGIHGITNEMVESAPRFAEIAEHLVTAFDSSDLLVGHHCPFDMGFVTFELERAGISIPATPSLCSSLLSRNHLVGPVNHKLQTLIPYLEIEAGEAHRALDDARACLQVALHCLQQIEKASDPPVQTILAKYSFQWPAFRIHEEPFLTLRDAVMTQLPLSFRYKDETRSATVLGIVRTPQGDFMAAICHRDNKEKRFYIARMSELQILDEPLE